MNVLEVLIYQYLCVCYRLIDGFILVFSCFIPLLSIFFARNIAYMYTCVRYTNKVFNILMFFIFYSIILCLSLYCR